MHESGIQTAILHYLALLENQGKVYAFRNNSFRGFIQRRNGTKGFIKNNKRGVPDIIMCYKGCFVGLEVKTEKGRQSQTQKEAEQAINEAGGYYYIVRSVDDVDEVLNLLDNSLT